MTQLISSLTCFGFILLAGCPGEAPTGGGPDAPAEIDAGVDAPPGAEGQRLSGKTMDYFSANTPMAEAIITSDGVAPVMMATSVMGGDFTFEGAPTGSKIYFSVARTLYRPTRNAPVTIAGEAVVQDLYLATLADINRQYTTVGLPPPTPTGGKAVIFAEIKKNDGTPLDGVPVTNVTLVDALDQPVPGVMGPYVFGALDIQPAPLPPEIANLVTINGRSRIAYLDVPPGAHTLKVTYLDNAVTTTMSVPVMTVADGATLSVTGGVLGTPLPPVITNPTFAAHIYPKLQKAALGGLGCANCHTAGGSAAGSIQYDLGATITLENMKLRPGLINLLVPADSLFLTKPLYEPPPYNHPNATFIDINDPDYKLFLLWIEQGALP